MEDVFYDVCQSGYSAAANQIVGNGAVPSFTEHSGPSTYGCELRWKPKWIYRDGSDSANALTVPADHTLYFDYNATVGGSECDITGSASTRCSSTYFGSDPGSYSTLTLVTVASEGNLTEYVNMGSGDPWGTDWPPYGRYVALQFRYRVVCDSTTYSSDWGENWQNVEDFDLAGSGTCYSGGCL